MVTRINLADGNTKQSADSETITAQKYGASAITHFTYNSQKYLYVAGSIKNDVHIKIGREVWEIEAKKRANGFAFIYQNIEGADALVIGADRKKPLAVIDYEDFLNLLAGKLWS